MEGKGKRGLGTMRIRENKGRLLKIARVCLSFEFS